MTKATLSTLDPKMYVSLINCVTFFPEINYCVQCFCGMIIIICLRTHVFSYCLNRSLFDLIMKELNVIGQNNKKGIRVTRTLDFTSYVFRLTNNFQFPQKLPLMQIKFHISQLISDRFLKTVVLSGMSGSLSSDN